MTKTLGDIFNRPGPLLVHDMDTEWGDRECETCSNDTVFDPEMDNTHVVFNDLRAKSDSGRSHVIYTDLKDLLVRAAKALEYLAIATVAGSDEHELMCWCGHSLHYIECPEAGMCHIADDPPQATYGWCRNKYVRENWRQMTVIGDKTITTHGTYTTEVR